MNRASRVDCLRGVDTNQANRADAIHDDGVAVDHAADDLPAGLRNAKQHETKSEQGCTGT
ncbi:MAG: hypothetical protein AB7F99_09210 [Vicinamibacterales bacterium]